MPEMQHIQELCQGWLSPGGRDEQSACRSLLSSVGDGKKYLAAAAQKARPLLNKAGASSNLISDRYSVTVNHCCVQVSKLTDKQEGREQGEKDGKQGTPSCSAHKTSAKSSTVPQKQ